MIARRGYHQVVYSRAGCRHYSSKRATSMLYTHAQAVNISTATGLQACCILTRRPWTLQQQKGYKQVVYSGAGREHYSSKRAISRLYTRAQAVNISATTGLQVGCILACWLSTLQQQKATSRLYTRAQAVNITTATGLQTCCILARRPWTFQQQQSYRHVVYSRAGREHYNSNRATSILYTRAQAVTITAATGLQAGCMRKCLRVTSQQKHWVVFRLWT